MISAEAATATQPLPSPSCSSDLNQVWAADSFFFFSFSGSKLGGGVSSGSRNGRGSGTPAAGKTHSKVRVNGLVCDIVGDILDLGIVLARLRSHDGRTRKSSYRGGKVAA